MVGGWSSVGFSCLSWPRWRTPVKVASIEGVTEYRLANGARVLLFSPKRRGRRSP